MDLGLDTHKHENGAVVLTVTGEVDLSTAPRLREAIVEAIADGATRLVVDLDHVEFLDSTGLGVLVGGLKRARSHDGDLALVCTQPRILKVFEITRLDSAFTIYKDVAEALEQER